MTIRCLRTNDYPFSMPFPSFTSTPIHSSLAHFIFHPTVNYVKKETALQLPIAPFTRHSPLLNQPRPFLHSNLISFTRDRFLSTASSSSSSSIQSSLISFPSLLLPILLLFLPPVFLPPSTLWFFPGEVSRRRQSLNFFHVSLCAYC